MSLTQAGVLRKDDNDYPVMGGTSAVDNQTIINSAYDPVTRRLLVDISGKVTGNTLQMEIPSGTVNGVNTVFTVQNIPEFVDTSGQVNVSSTQDATNYGFVVTGSAPYTLTFVNAPTQTPHSFYNVYPPVTNVNVENEVVSGSGYSFTLANTPVLGSQAIYGNGQRLYPGVDYSISGENLNMTDSWTVGSILADYSIDEGEGFIYNEIVSGSGTSFTLAHTPISGTQELYGNGQRLYPITDYTISGASITTVNSWLAAQILADYQEN